MKKPAVIVVSHNTRLALAECLASVVAESAVEIVVVDNASTDGSAAMVHTDFPEARLITNLHNPGFGAAANQGLRICTAPYALLLNADTRLLPGTLVLLKGTLDRDLNAAIVGPRIVGIEGHLQISAFPFPTLLPVFLDLAGFAPGNRWLRRALGSEPSEPRQVDWVLGAAMMLRCEAILAIGGFDEGYSMYFEETDLCYRLCELEWRTLFVDSATIVHIGGASTVQGRHWWDVQLFRSRFRFYRCHYSPGRLVGLRLVVGTGMAAKLGRDVVRRAVAQDHSSRSRLREDIRIWSRVLGMAVRGDDERACRP